MPQFRRKKSVSVSKPRIAFTRKKPTSSRVFKNALTPQEVPAVPLPADQPVPEVQEIHRVIEQNKSQLADESPTTVAETENVLDQNVVDHPSDFNGVSGNEQWQLVDAELRNEQRKSTKLNHELQIIKQDYEQEKQRLEQQIRDLKRELHRTSSVENHSFFSISKDLKEAMGMIDKILGPEAQKANTATPPQFTLPDMKQATPPPPAEPAPPEMTPSASPPPIPADTVKEVKKQIPAPPEPEATTEKKKQNTKRKKVLITGGVAVAIFLAGSVGASTLLMKPKVNDALVKEYLDKNGQVQGASDTAKGANTPPTTGTNGQPDNSQNDVPYDQTVWTQLFEPMFGVNLQYPQNTVKIQRSESNITFIRKDGYIFRIQKIETGLALEEYWKQIKPSNPNYSDTKAKFKEKEALLLHLEEIAKYPGDRYLVKMQNAIYDIWYATPSDVFNQDDIKRAKHMLDTLTLLETKV